MCRSHRSTIASGLLGIALGASGVAQAQSAQSSPTAGDQHFIVARQVHPRIAYRPVPRAELPIRVQATVFPGRAFHSTLGASLAQPQGSGPQGVDDAVLDHTRSASGLAAISPSNEAASASARIAPTAWQAGNAAPLGAGANHAGATRDLGAAIGASVGNALQGLQGAGR